MKYTIKLGGRGGECYVHKITSEQTEQIRSLGDLSKDAQYDDIMGIIEKEMFDDTEERYLGPYNSHNDFYLLVVDENNKVILESNENFEFPDLHDEDQDFIMVADDENILIIEDYVKGNFFNFELEINEEFNPEKLTPILTDVGDIIQLITDLKYDGQILEKDYDDYSSKGFYFHLT